MAATLPRRSPFLYESPTTSAGDLAIVQVSRDSLAPVLLRDYAGAVDGYAEGDVVNTRFGSYPHSTLLGIQWGSQVRASTVDTGSRGRKRKRDGQEDGGRAGSGQGKGPDQDKEVMAPRTTTASSGFVHVLRPTPELWTMSLPHRTQVVYTPDYSFILQRLHAVPGTQLIEAGAGSGSFTHASARAVFSGAPTGLHDAKGRGKVWSFEFNEDRYEKMRHELEVHALQDVVRLTRRNVYDDGFLVDGKSPLATAVFLDLPAPWQALPRLSRRRSVPARQDSLATTATPTESTPTESVETDSVGASSWVSPLDPSRTAYICTFSPCIEQVTRTISTLRELGWVDVDMIEIAHKKFIVSRERLAPGPNSDPAPRDVAEALARLRHVNKRADRFHNPQRHQQANGDEEDGRAGEPHLRDDHRRRPWRFGRLQSRPEAEVKTHTSYLVFAVLPREWSDADEDKALRKWGAGSTGKVVGHAADKATRKQLKAEIHMPKKQRKAAGRAS